MFMLIISAEHNKNKQDKNMSETIPSLVRRDNEPNSDFPTPADVFETPKTVGSDETSPTTHEEIIDADIVEEAPENAVELRGDTVLDRAANRFMSAAASFHERRLTTQTRRDARNELREMRAEARNSDEARANYRSRILELKNSDDAKINRYATVHGNRESRHDYREALREEAKSKLKSLGRSAIRGAKLGLGAAVGTGILAMESAGRGIASGKEATVATAHNAKETALSNLDGAKEAYVYRKQERARDRQKRADERAPEVLRQKREAAERAAKATERKDHRKELFKQLADSYKESTGARLKRERPEPTPTEVVERQQRRRSRLGNLALKFGAAREAYKNAGQQERDPNQDKLF